SLMSRILATARECGCRTVTLNLQLAAASVFADLDRFLQWFCASTGKSLGLENRVADYWDDIFGSNYNCTDYFENYLLTACDSPLVLALDDADRVFQYPEIASEFFGLLRAWYEKAKYGDSGSPSFEKLRLVVVHSTEVYIPLNYNQSPFNVGLSIDLPPLAEFQVQDLSLRHGLEMSGSQIDQLMALVGGNPYLLRVAMYHIRRRDITFEQLLKTAATEGGIYSDHLRRQWRHLQECPELAAAFELVIASDVPVELDSKLGFKLQSMGLIILWGGEVTASCDLYRQYFRRPPSQWKQLSDRIAKLERDNQELQQLVKVDSLTQLANRRCFDEYLNLEWRRLAQLGKPLSLILCDIDFFKAYNDTYGHPAGDECLQKVAKAISTALKSPDDLAARYGGEEFALVLPDTSVEGALLTAEIIRANLKGLLIPHSNSDVGYFLTLSLGVSTIVPSLESSPAAIVHVADQALYEAKAQGRDRTVLKLFS
ncbi:MAG TPA: AAA-like domain-containing protein, partial [Kamptonema sp.]|nr:AAA-like domain-containing protein [Kamptonema sp.]